MDRSRFRTARLASAALVALAVTAPGAGRAQLVYPGPAPCDGTLQACVDAAPASATVLVATDGPIAESIAFSKSLELAAAEGFVPVFTAGSSIFASTAESGSHFIRIAGLHLTSGVIQVGQASSESLGVEIVGNRATGTGSHSAIRILAGNVGPLRGPVFFAIEDNTVRVENAQEDGGISIAMNDNADATGVIRDNVVEALGIAQGAAISVPNGSRTVDVAIVRNRIFGASFNTGIGVFQFAPGNLSARIVGNEIRGQLGNVGAPGAISVIASQGALDVAVVNNTIVASRIAILVSGRPDLGAVVTGEIANNLLAGNQRGFSLAPSIAPGVPDRNNLFFDNDSDFSDEEGEPFVPGPGTVFADPLFAGPDDLSLLPASPARDAGATSALPPTYNVDLADNPRVVGAAVDIGAYEAPEPAAGLASAAAGTALALLRRRKRAAAADRAREAARPCRDRAIP